MVGRYINVWRATLGEYWTYYEDVAGFLGEDLWEYEQEGEGGRGRESESREEGGEGRNGKKWVGKKVAVKLAGKKGVRDLWGE